MSILVATFQPRAKALSAEDRARLAEELLESLQDEIDADSESAWDREIQRRVAEIDAGAVRLISAKEVHAEGRRLIRGEDGPLSPRGAYRADLHSEHEFPVVATAPTRTWPGHWQTRIHDRPKTKP